MNSNRVICRNEVYIEDENVGHFESFESNGDAHAFGETAILTIPLYAIGSAKSGEARSRIRNVFKNTNIKPCAEVRVYCWYEGEEKQLVFSGFIEHIGEGFPTKLYLHDNTFILRFGQIQKGWTASATLQSIVNDCIPIAQEGFKKERENLGFKRTLPELSYSVGGKNVQAVTTALSFRNWGARSPYDTIQKLMSLLTLYAGVTTDYKVFIGAGVKDSTRPVIKLDTRYNVIGRDIVPVDGRFVDYDVKISGVLSDGKHYTATGGYGTKSTNKKDDFDKKYGETYRGFSVLNTAEGLQDFADRQLNMLKGTRNKGDITLLCYPKVQLLDQVDYNDTVFSELSGLYYVLNYKFKASDNGYFQVLGVTDKVYML